MRQPPRRLYRFCSSRANGLWCPDWAESPDSARRAVNFPIGRFDTPPFPSISAQIWFCGPVRLFPASLNPASPRPPTTCRRRDPAGGVRLLTRNGYDWTARALGRRSYHPFYFTAIFSLPLVLGEALRPDSRTGSSRNKLQHIHVALQRVQCGCDDDCRSFQRPGALATTSGRGPRHCAAASKS